MFVDLFTQLSDEQAIAAATTTLMTNVIDLSAIDPDIGVGEVFGLQITVDVAADFTSANETYVFEIINDDDPAMGTPVVFASFPILAVNLALGDKHFLPMPSGTLGERYLSGQIVTAGTTPIITFSAHFAPQSMGESTYRNHASGFLVSG